MPLNTLRLNHAPSSHPNDRIVFIKPLARPASEHKDYETADLLLRAIAAQCLPVMKANHLSVTTLEEHEPNPEFIGRNFNNGEIIQLVLRSRGGSWLSVRMIQMVMMHELAHNVQMNHSRKFWEVRNKYASEMRALWARNYTGDGLWGSGRVLGDLDGVMRSGNGVVGSDELKDLPLCGGTFRSRGRRRKRKNGNGDVQQLSWREKKERRIEKKFGKNGVALGEDEDKRLMLEGLGKGPIGVKPRVAQSKRGRELRAAAALARFQSNKREAENLAKLQKEDESAGSETDEGEEYEEVDEDGEDAHDILGNRILDHNGRGMIRVCGDEDDEDVAVKQEMDELEELLPSQIQHIKDHENEQLHQPVTPKTKSTDDQPADDQISSSSYDTQHLQQQVTEAVRKSDSFKPSGQSTKVSGPPNQDSESTGVTACPICTTENPTLGVTCMACSHVLDRRKDPRSWHCESEVCRQSPSTFLNAGDCGICGICGERRAKQPQMSVSHDV